MSNRTRDAKQLGEDAFKNASRTLEILENFNASLNAQKERVDGGKKLEAKINTNLETSRTLHYSIGSGLETAQADLSKVATNVAHMNQEMANANKSLARLKDESSDLKERASTLEKNVDTMKNEHDDSKESIGSMSSKYSELPNRLANLQTQSEDVLRRSQTLFSNVNNAQETLDTLMNANLGL